MPAAKHAVATATLAALAGLLVSTDDAAAQFSAPVVDDRPEPAWQGELADAAQPLYLQDVSDDDRGQNDVDDFKYRPNVSPWYARGAVLLLFPQDMLFTNVASEEVPSDDPTSPGTVDQGVEQDITLGWGGGLNVAVGYGFKPNDKFNPRVEAEYTLLLADFRDANDDGMTWNGLGVNGLVDMRLSSNIKLYAGAGAGLAYVSFANPPAPLSSGLLTNVGSDDDVTFYLQGLGGTSSGSTTPSTSTSAFDT